MRSPVMKLIIGAIAYLSAVTAFVLAAVFGLSFVEPRQQVETTAFATPADDEARLPTRAADAAKAEEDRVPVWIVPTAKYEYTPVPVDQKPKHSPVIGRDARAAQARVSDRSRADGRNAIERAFGETSAGRGQALGFARSRDNDPFFRD